ncbi:Crp/Fnr family transcriptional regulator [Amycolatopsis sp. A1MSW2902]|uniref:Crp/Fnr family transcriptional regulator n=1 Tax=Amycolatopsis sp. A1MSW2902 TaxID=687413 RepID=UPI00307F3FB8
MTLGSPQRVRPRKPVLAVGKAGVDVVVLQQGHVKVTSTDHEARQVILDVGGPGDIYGEAAVISGRPRMADVIALDEVVLRRIDAQTFRRFLLENPAANYETSALLSERLWNAQRERTNTRTPDMVVQIARRLLYLVDVCASPHDGGWSVDAPLTQEEQAAFIPVSRGTLAKALKRLRSQHVIRTGRRSLTVIDIEQLQSLAEMT